MKRFLSTLLVTTCVYWLGHWMGARGRDEYKDVAFLAVENLVTCTGALDTWKLAVEKAASGAVRCNEQLLNCERKEGV